ncbi:hypothetical protein [Brucella anthropi]|uniref:hypothetical protein n=1 Tax=Brucella anthropi TaxID=529 RepID=UPI00244B748E|nr:hypothetical protein [Brucella anthropi]MDH0369677.1 hypothetical protein [Brucella anthropi]
MAIIDGRIHGEMDLISYGLAQRVRVLAERYEVKLTDLSANVSQLEVVVGEHLKWMGFAW